MYACVYACVCVPMSFTRVVHRSKRDTDEENVLGHGVKKKMFIPPSVTINYLQILKKG